MLIRRKLMKRYGAPLRNPGSVEGWKTLPIAECGEPLVGVGAFSNYREFATSPIYFGAYTDSPYQGGVLKGALCGTFLREGVANRLKAAAYIFARVGCMLLIWDGYRPQEVQKALFDYELAKLVGQGMPRERAMEEAQKFVSIPSEDPTRPPPHYTGGAVDLTLIRFRDPLVWRRVQELTKIVQIRETENNWQYLYRAEMFRQELIRMQSELVPMGTVFDAVHPETETLFFEHIPEKELTPTQRECRDNRRLLWNVLAQVGLSNYSAEWWHGDYGNQFAAARTGKPAVYGGLELSAKNWRYEQLRRGNYRGNVAIQNNTHPQLHLKTGPTHPLFEFVQEVALNTGDIRQSAHPRADVI